MEICLRLGDMLNNVWFVHLTLVSALQSSTCWKGLEKRRWSWGWVGIKVEGDLKIWFLVPRFLYVNVNIGTMSTKTNYVKRWWLTSRHATGEANDPQVLVPHFDKSARSGRGDQARDNRTYQKLSRFVKSEWIFESLLVFVQSKNAVIVLHSFSIFRSFCEREIIHCTWFLYIT